MTTQPVTSMKIGLFGGSFNPPTIAHLALARYAHEHLQLDQLWWLVAPHNPDKPKASLAPYPDRLAMCELAAKDDDWLIVSDWEDRLGTQQTADTLKGIRDNHPLHAFIWLMGADNLVHFHHWDHWQMITPLAVFSRPGEIEAALQSPAAIAMADQRVTKDFPLLQPPQWALFANPDMAVSATKVREAIASGQEPPHILPIVADYIQQHGLYRPA